MLQKLFNNLFFEALNFYFLDTNNVGIFMDWMVVWRKYIIRHIEKYYKIMNLVKHYIFIFLFSVYFCCCSNHKTVEAKTLQGHCPFKTQENGITYVYGCDSFLLEEYGVVKDGSYSEEEIYKTTYHYDEYKKVIEMRLYLFKDTNYIIKDSSSYYMKEVYAYLNNNTIHKVEKFYAKNNNDSSFIDIGGSTEDWVLNKVYGPNGEDFGTPLKTNRMPKKYAH